jgi:hypothetical protein
MTGVQVFEGDGYDPDRWRYRVRVDATIGGFEDHDLEAKEVTARLLDLGVNIAIVTFMMGQAEKRFKEGWESPSMNRPSAEKSISLWAERDKA